MDIVCYLEQELELDAHSTIVTSARRAVAVANDAGVGLYLDVVAVQISIEADLVLAHVARDTIEAGSIEVDH